MFYKRASFFMLYKIHKSIIQKKIKKEYKKILTKTKRSAKMMQQKKRRAI